MHKSMHRYTLAHTHTHTHTHTPTHMHMHMHMHKLIRTQASARKRAPSHVLGWQMAQVMCAWLVMTTVAY